ncbi:hypothetical protein Tco_0840792 [Tanacetum coccineum]|uniref:Uncharacterized protein n=1 Tax=Tanacetum coccineum TaxID=301880 RepID=A0ABQ5AUY3_9ASTR
MYRLVAIVVDADLTNGTQVAWTEAFLLRDYRSTYGGDLSKAVRLLKLDAGSSQKSYKLSIGTSQLKAGNEISHFA